MARYIDLTNKEELWLGIFAGFNQIIFVYNFVFAIYNTFKYLVPSKIT